MSYRERPEPEPLQTWRDRVTLGKVLKWPMLVGAFALVCRLAWKAYSGKSPDGLDYLAAVLVGLGAAFCIIFCAINWDSPISKWKWPS